VLAHHPELRTVRSPYADGEELVAMPALTLDAALVHVHRADAAGNGQLLGPDPYFDDLYLGAAKLRLLSCERVVPTSELAQAPLQTLRINRMLVDAVIEAPGGAAFTDCEPDYGRDEAAQRDYADSAASPEKWAEFYDRFVGSRP
jgi:glutaconate CoA-transferase subunit A